MTDSRPTVTTLTTMDAAPAIIHHQLSWFRRQRCVNCEVCLIHPRDAQHARAPALLCVVRHADRAAGRCSMCRSSINLVLHLYYWHVARPFWTVHWRHFPYHGIVSKRFSHFDKTALLDFFCIQSYR